MSNGDLPTDALLEVEAHGPQWSSHHPNGGFGPATDMAPLKGYKGVYYEGGIREPFLVKWPGRVKPGTKCSVPIHGVDLYPTFCEMMKTKLPEQPLDGVSIVPLMTGAKASLGERPLFWHFPAYLQSYGGGTATSGEQRDPLFRTRPCSIVRLGDWKLHQYFEDGGLELYNLKEDIGESTNLADENAAKTRELLGVLEAWQKEIGAPIPKKLNPAFDEKAHAAALAQEKRGKNRKK